MEFFAQRGSLSLQDLQQPAADYSGSQEKQVQALVGSGKGFVKRSNASFDVRIRDDGTDIRLGGSLCDRQDIDVPVRGSRTCGRPGPA